MRLGKTINIKITTKETIDLGDILIDPYKAVISKDSEAKDRITARFDAEADKVRSGEKKSMLKIFAKEGANDALDYILKHQNEQPLASFALFVI